ncbi:MULTISPECIES: glycosyltransferase [Geobacter]|uniref:Glycosyl transferase n=2 Tax=Geobacter TaxID=28231 RepID=A0A0C1QWI7_9BACT|nr:MULTISPECIES: glycosyltransferase family 2 protein [Geobacter]KIE42506.1 glycosyl transferase [Geobacter soli]MBE2887208.1 glycosyltransferase family 2 protein [Geobacter anodireducens]
MTLPFVSVIIPTFNRGALLEGTIRSFLTQKYPHDRFEILVADNNSTDNTKRVVERFQGGAVSVRYHFEPRQGVHYARNGAASIAVGDILYFTDDDMIADSLLLAEITAVFRLDDRIGCATGKVMPKFAVEPPAWVGRCLVNSLLSLTAYDREEELEVTRACIAYSCHQAILREAFFTSGGFNPENTAGVWIGDGETGLNLKLRAQGWLFAYTSRSLIYHVIPPERMTLGYLMKRMSNQANCDSCTDYRFHRQRWGILPRMLRRNTLGIARVALETILKIAAKKESWHFIPARCLYFARRNSYDIKLLLDGDFKALVERDDWIEKS